jgi:putative membrane protein
VQPHGTLGQSPHAHFADDGASGAFIPVQPQGTQGQSRHAYFADDGASGASVPVRPLDMQKQNPTAETGASLRGLPAVLVSYIAGIASVAIWAQFRKARRRIGDFSSETEMTADLIPAAFLNTPEFPEDSESRKIRSLEDGTKVAKQSHIRMGLPNLQADGVTVGDVRNFVEKVEDEQRLATCRLEDPKLKSDFNVVDIKKLLDEYGDNDSVLSPEQIVVLRHENVPLDVVDDTVAEAVPDLSRDDAPSPEPTMGRDENEAQAWRDYLNTLGKINKDPDANHDDVALRDINGVELAIPRAERYQTKDWMHILGQTHSSVVLKQVTIPVVIMSCWAAVICAGQHWLQIMPATFSAVPHTLVGSALSLLLVFRTNAAYNRFWEGRQMWQQVLDESRALARLCKLYRDKFEKGRFRRTCDLLCAFGYVFRQHLTGRKSMQIKDLIPEEDRRMLKEFRNAPLYLLNTLSEEFNAINFAASDRERMRLAFLGHINRIGNCVGACERIIQTPVPLNYTRHTTRLMTIWCMTLPLAIVGVLRWATIPIIALITWGLFGIQEIGLMIEEPFSGSLQLEVIAQTINADVIETVNADVFRSFSKNREARENT